MTAEVAHPWLLAAVVLMWIAGIFALTWGRR
jgi:hypothetical protein